MIDTRNRKLCRGRVQTDTSLPLPSLKTLYHATMAGLEKGQFKVAWKKSLLNWSFPSPFLIFSKQNCLLLLQLLLTLLSFGYHPSQAKCTLGSGENFKSDLEEWRKFPNFYISFKLHQPVPQEIWKGKSRAKVLPMNSIKMHVVGMSIPWLFLSEIREWMIGSRRARSLGFFLL